MNHIFSPGMRSNAEVLANLSKYMLIILFLTYLAKSVVEGLGLGALELIILLIAFVYVKPWGHKRFYKILLPYFGFFVVSIWSSYSGWNYYELAIDEVFTQILIHLKIIFGVGFFLVLLTSPNFIRGDQLYRWLKVIVAATVVVIVIQMMEPEIYSSLLPGVKLDTYVSGLGWRRYTGIFYHPSPLGFFSAVMFIFILYSIRNDAEKYIWLFLILSVLLLSGQRGELVFMMLAISVYHVFPNIVTRILSSTFAVFISLLVSLVFLFWFSSNFYTLSEDSIARTVLYNGGLELARKEFPFGAGLSSYGSATSYGSVAYYDLGIERLWWYQQDLNYITDTFWGMIIGEVGVVGVIFYAWFCAAFISHLLRISFSRVGIIVLLFLLFEMLTNPIFTGSFLYVFVVLYLVALGGRNERID